MVPWMTSLASADATTAAPMLPPVVRTREFTPLAIAVESMGTCAGRPPRRPLRRGRAQQQMLKALANWSPQKLRPPATLMSRMADDFSAHAASQGIDIPPRARLG